MRHDDTIAVTELYTEKNPNIKFQCEFMGGSDYWQKLNTLVAANDMMMQFIQGLPMELDEAATIDGCNKYTIFSRIILPLLTPALITTVIIQFYWKWDEFLGPLLYLSRPEKYTVSLALKSFVDSTSVTDYGALFAMSTLSLIPVFLLFLFFNNYLLEGISTTGMKG